MFQDSLRRPGRGIHQDAGKKGDFYRIAGEKARSIDGPTRGTIPPFNNAVSLSPLAPRGVSRSLASKFNCRAAVVDVNDIGGNILGCWPVDTDGELLVRILSDNPLGQGRARTPAGIIRELTLFRTPNRLSTAEVRREITTAARTAHQNPLHETAEEWEASIIISPLIRNLARPSVSI